MLAQFKSHINERFPELLGQKSLLACSGGVDSIVLAHLFTKCNLDFAIAHCNFQLRKQESDDDDAFVTKLANNIDKKIYVMHFNTMSYVNKNKVSVQMAARELRYNWFSKIMKEGGYKILVTAHHADDNLETFLINLSRGTGLNGLTGIPEKTDSLSRPLLPFSREQILDYAKAEKLRWREDMSNQDLKYLRNKIRHGIVPHLKELQHTFLANFLLTQEYLTGSASILENHIHDIKEKFFQQEKDVVKIPVEKLLNLTPLKAYMHALFQDYGFTEWDDVVGLLTAMSGKEVQSRTHRLVKDRAHLLVQQLQSENSTRYQILAKEASIETPIHLSIEKVEIMNETSKKVLYVDKETLNHKLIVRKWQKGDYFYPLGMKGKKKISKFFKDEKMDVISKEEQWLLCSGDNIVWVIGKRADDRFKVAKKTKSILKFTLQE